MREETRWGYKKTSLILLTLIIFTIVTQTSYCNATEQENKTLSEVSSYDFPAGYYQVVKHADNSTSEFRILHETELPYLNISYIAPTTGLVEVTLNSNEGYLPYIELSRGWALNGLTYLNPMLQNETCYLLLTPPLEFTDSNTSIVVGGEVTLWEMYKWSNTSGVITYSFTASDDITIELVMYPINPQQGYPLTFFTSSNMKMKNIQWSFPEFGWMNQSETLEVNGLKEGTYMISVTMEDIFNNTHTKEMEFTVLPATLNPQSFDLNFFSISYPEKVTKGDEVTISATIDYSIPTDADIKCQLINPVTNLVYKELTYIVSNTGSKQFNHKFIAENEGVEPLILKLFYDVGEGWVEVFEAEETLMLNIDEVDPSNNIPGFNIFSVITGLMVASILFKKLKYCF